MLSRRFREPSNSLAGLDSRHQLFVVNEQTSLSNKQDRQTSSSVNFWPIKHAPPKVGSRQDSKWTTHPLEAKLVGYSFGLFFMPVLCCKTDSNWRMPSASVIRLSNIEVLLYTTQNFSTPADLAQTHSGFGYMRSVGHSLGANKESGSASRWNAYRYFMLFVGMQHKTKSRVSWYWSSLSCYSRCNYYRVASSVYSKLRAESIGQLMPIVYPAKLV